MLATLQRRPEAVLPTAADLKLASALIRALIDLTAADHRRKKLEMDPRWQEIQRIRKLSKTDKRALVKECFISMAAAERVGFLAELRAMEAGKANGAMQ